MASRETERNRKETPRTAAPREEARREKKGQLDICITNIHYNSFQTRTMPFSTSPTTLAHLQAHVSFVWTKIPPTSILSVPLTCGPTRPYLLPPSLPNRYAHGRKRRRWLTAAMERTCSPAGDLEGRGCATPNVYRSCEASSLASCPHACQVKAAAAVMTGDFPTGEQGSGEEKHTKRISLSTRTKPATFRGGKPAGAWPAADRAVMAARPWRRGRKRPWKLEEKEKAER